MDRLLEVDGNQVIAEFVEKPWIRNSYLRFRDGRLIVTSRNRRAGERLVSRYMPWISRHYREISSYIRLFDSGSVFYRSRRYAARYVAAESRPRADVDGGTLVLYARDFDAAERLLDRMVREDTERSAREMGMQKASLLGVAFKDIKARRYRKWGACRSDGSITINYCTSMLPRELQDYIVSHEVAHLKHMDHSKRFWEAVGTLCPDYRALRKRLKDYDSTRRRIYTAATNLA